MLTHSSQSEMKSWQQSHAWQPSTPGKPYATVALASTLPPLRVTEVFVQVNCPRPGVGSRVAC